MTTKLFSDTAVLMILTTVVVTQRVPGHFAGYPASGQFQPRLTNNVQKYTRQRLGAYSYVQTPRRFSMPSSGHIDLHGLTNPLFGLTGFRPNNDPNLLYRKPIRGEFASYQRAPATHPQHAPIIQNGDTRQRANYGGRLVYVTPRFVANTYYTTQQLRQPLLVPKYPQGQRVVQAFPQIIPVQQSFATPRRPRYVKPHGLPVIALPRPNINLSSRLSDAQGGYGTRRNTENARQNTRGSPAYLQTIYQGQPMSSPTDRRRYSSMDDSVDYDECTNIPGNPLLHAQCTHARVHLGRQASE